MSARRVYPESYRRGFTLPLVIGLVVALIILGMITFLQFKPKPQIPNFKPQTQTQTATQSATPNPTTNWNTFTSSKWGFNVKYPKDWKVAKDTNTGASLIKEADQYGEPEVDFDFVHITTTPTRYNNLLTYPVGKAVEVKPEGQINKEMDMYTRLADTTVDGYKAVRTKIDFGYKDLGVNDAYEVFIVKGDKIIMVSISVGVKLDDKVALVDQILSTLKFLN